ncbi:hypothetical protein G4D64_09615 [Bacillus sp. 3H-10]|uniref:Uncharacterized protein n=1 Tax=Bacillus aquiflavi TaxID=2672567 RepID=A0A6B3VXU7_9BACI|nr:hypothetical protein [Bacillus aquiflavi]
MGTLQWLRVLKLVLHQYSLIYFIRNIYLKQIEGKKTPSFLVYLLSLTSEGIFNFINGLGEEGGLGSKVSLFF